jgi:hypothetical protein
MKMQEVSRKSLPLALAYLLVLQNFLKDLTWELPGSQSLQYQLACLQRIECSETNHDECMTAIEVALGKLGLPGS